jgi:hypothetical protein
MIMDERQFWGIIQAAYVEDEDAWLDSLKSELLKLPPEEIVAFKHKFDALVDAADKHDLWGAAYLILGGCSDDGFHYFRCWLIGRGEAIYRRALADPDTLADVLTGEETSWVPLDAAASRAWVEKTGRSEDEYFRELDKLGVQRQQINQGPVWDFDDNSQMRRRFPRLSAIYLDEANE